MDETGFLSVAGTPFEVDSRLTGNLYGQYEFDDSFGIAANTRLRAGVRNITNEAPPLASGGYLGSLYTPYGRYWYMSVAKTF